VITVQIGPPGIGRKFAKWGYAIARFWNPTFRDRHHRWNGLLTGQWLTFVDGSVRWYDGTNVPWDAYDDYWEECRKIVDEIRSGLQPDK
jgi:hypothetical protein